MMRGFPLLVLTILLFQVSYRASAAPQKGERPAIAPPLQRPDNAQNVLPPQQIKPGQPEGKEDRPQDPAAADVELLRKLGVATDEKNLLEYFRERTYPETDPALMDRLVLQLGSPSFQIREKAFAKIAKLGSGALFTLKKSKEAPDMETKRRVQDLLQMLEDKANPAVQSAVARLIALRKPAGSSGVLLNYLPFAADESVQEEIFESLASLAVQKGKADDKIVAALEAKLPLKRMAAGYALAKSKSKDQLPAVLNLLKDADPKVRLRVALVMANLENKQAVDTLVELIGKLPPEQLWQAETVLVRLAGENTPEVTLGTDEESRKKAHELWNAWWQKNREKIDLSKLNKDDSYKGYMLLVYQVPNRVINGRLVQGGREILELDEAKKKRWAFVIQNTFPVDAEVIDRKRVLLTEYNGRRVSERDFDGRILWETYFRMYPISAQRLTNGNTFVVLQNQLVELDRKGKEIWTYNRPNSDILRGQKLRNGTIVFVSRTGDLIYLEPKTQKIIKSFNVGNVGTYYGGIDVLNNGNVIVPQYSNNMVTEYNPAGRVVWKANVNWPSSAVRLPNGHTLVGSLNTNQVVELNRQGQVVWSRQFEGQVYRVQIR